MADYEVYKAGRPKPGFTVVTREGAKLLVPLTDLTEAEKAAFEAKKAAKASKPAKAPKAPKAPKEPKAKGKRGRPKGSGKGKAGRKPRGVPSVADTAKALVAYAGSKDAIKSVIVAANLDHESVDAWVNALTSWQEDVVAKEMKVLADAISAKSKETEQLQAQLAKLEKQAKGKK